MATKVTYCEKLNEGEWLVKVATPEGRSGFIIRSFKDGIARVSLMRSTNFNVCIEALASYFEENSDFSKIFHSMYDTDVKVKAFRLRLLEVEADVTHSNVTAEDIRNFFNSERLKNVV